MPASHADILDKVEAERSQLLADVSGAAARGDSTAILALGARLQLFDGHKASIEAALSGALADLSPAGHGARNRGVPVGSIDGELSPKAKGKKRTRDFLTRLESQGISLTPLNGVVYETVSKKRVGIATSSEHPRTRSGDRFWWLGLPGDEFDVAVLLADDETLGRVRAVVLAEDTLANVLGQLSRDHRNQVKFVLNASGSSQLALALPNVGPYDVSNCEDDFDALG